MTQEIIAGAACRILVNGRPIGIANSISIQRQQTVKPIYGIDVMLPQEIAITGPYAVRGQISGFRTRYTKGWDGLGVVNASTVENLLNQLYCQLEIYDRASGELIAKVDKVLFYVDNIQVGARGLMTISAQFMGVFMSTPLTPGA